MAKYTIELATLKKEGESASTGKKWSIYKLNLKDEAGVSIEVDTFDSVMSGEIVEGEIIETQYGKSFKKVTPKAVAGANFKTQQIEKTAFAIQDKKSESIAKAQDRSAWMWAKTNASTLLAGNIGKMNHGSNAEIADDVLDLATRIYNGEPLTPFN